MNIYGHENQTMLLSGLTSLFIFIDRFRPMPSEFKDGSERIHF